MDASEALCYHDAHIDIQRNQHRVLTNQNLAVCQDVFFCFLSGFFRVFPFFLDIIPRNLPYSCSQLPLDMSYKYIYIPLSTEIFIKVFLFRQK